MMSCKKGKFPYSSFMLLTQWHQFPAPKLTNFHIFIIPLSLNLTLFSKSLYLTAHVKLWNRLYWKVFWKNTDVSRNVAKVKIKVFVALVGRFQPLTNFTKNPNIGAMGVLNTLLEYCKEFWNLRKWLN